VAALARLSLRDPEYVEVHAGAEAPTPVRLQQAYMECALPDKLDILWSFIRTHLRARTIVFLSTCKQVRFVHEAFRRLRPGVPLRALHGRMSQHKRLAVFQDFCGAKAGVLLATDVAARGLDFPSVDWVVQADCPEDVDAYIHRVGRTARYTAAGHGLLLLVPSEAAGMLAQLAAAKVPIRALRHNPAKLQPITPALQALLSKDAALKETAQRALACYLRSVFLQPNRAVFDVTKLPAADLALSWGLPSAPKLRFLKRAVKSKGKAGAAAAEAESGSEEEGEDEAARAGGGGPGGGDGSGGEDPSGSGSGSGSDDELLVVKRRDVLGVGGAGSGTAEEAAALALPPSDGGGGGGRKKRLRIKPNAGSGTRTVFDEEGQEVDPLSRLAAGAEGGDADGGGGGGHASVAARGAAAREVMERRDAEDRAALRDLRKAQRDGKRARRLAREAEEAGGAGAALAGSDSERDGGGSGGESSDEEGRGQSSGSDADVDLLMDSDDEGGGGGGGGGEVAHLGMVPAGRQPAEEAPGGKKGRKRGRGAAGLTLGEQEALALHMLRQKAL
jgi:ATP-dependent RNA helicase DDX10/DBP4